MGKESAGLAALANAVVTRSTTAVALVQMSLDRIAQHNPALNAVISIRASEALAEAHAVDAAVAIGEPLGPLAGIPFLVKDIEDVAGLVTTKGSLTLAHEPAADNDGLITSRLKAAGAIALGKTNLPEFAVEGFTSNLLFGSTRNPWSTEHSPGGSSGGSAAALASGMVPIATATDGGGSIRIPAAFCGLVGIKPTRGLIGRRPIPDWIDLSTDGPIASSVDDLRLLLRIMTGPVTGDPDSFQGSPLTRPERPARLIVVPRTGDFGPLPDDVALALQESATRFAEMVNCELIWLTAQEVFPTGSPDEDWFVIAAAEHVSSLGREWVQRHLEQLHPSTREFLSFGMTVGIDTYLDARRRRFDYTRCLDELLASGDLMVSPTVAISGIAADGSLDGTGRLGASGPEWYSTMITNLTGHPAISLPAGQCSNGVPFGLQLTGPRQTDGWLLDLGTEWEHAYPWPLTAPGYHPFRLEPG